MLRARTHARIVAMGDFNTSPGYMSRKFHDIQQHTSTASLPHTHAYTFRNSRGHSSLVDHFLVDTDILHTCRMLPPLRDSPSDHFPIRMSIRVLMHSSAQHTRHAIPPAYLSRHAARFRWVDDKAHLLIGNIRAQLHDIPAQFDTPQALSDYIIDKLHAAAAPLDLLVMHDDTSEPMPRTPKRPFTLPPHAVELGKHIRTLARSGLAPNVLKEMRREFKRHVSWAKLRMAWFRGKQLADRFKHEPRRAWAGFKRKSNVFCCTSISLSQWHQHYSSMFTAQHGMHQHQWQRYVRSIPVHDRQPAHDRLFNDITVGEMRRVATDSNHHAAQGVDAIPTELLLLFYEDADKVVPRRPDVPDVKTSRRQDGKKKVPDGKWHRSGKGGVITSLH